MADGTMHREGDHWVASNAIVTGDVTLGEDVNVWYGCSVRGDEAAITIGARTNIQDNCIVHCDPEQPQVIGEEVTVGHGAILHGLTIGDGCLIGMGAILLQECEIGEECLIGAGTLVKQGMKVPPRSVVLGVPGRVIRQVTDEEAAVFRQSAAGYIVEAREHEHGKHARPPAPPRP